MAGGPESSEGAPSARLGEDVSNGVFIAFEGIDGSGTTTQATRYAEHLRARRRLVHVTREPSGGPVGSLLRLVLTHRMMLPAMHHAETMALLFAADRLDHLASEITPLLDDGYVVLSDRYDLSSLAYQATTALDQGKEQAPMLRWIRDMNRHARRPDLTLVLDVRAEVAAQRRKGRGGAHELFDDEELQARLCDIYRKAEELVPGDRLVHIDGSGDPEAIAREIAATLDVFVAR
jgi:dTMP kinase